MSDAYRIEPATEADLRSLAVDIASQPLLAAYGTGAEALAASWVRALSAGQTFLVAHNDKGPQGLVWFSSQGAFGRGAYLRFIGVVASSQGAGLGARLLEAFEVYSNQPAGGWFLLTSHFNSGAQRFYEKYGYRCVGELPGFVKSNITERIYWKPRAP